MHTKIVHRFPIKIYLLLLIFCCGAFSSIVDTLRVFQQCVDSYPYKVSFWRIQTYRSIALNASGRAEFDCNQKIFVSYNRPFKYSVRYSDSATVTISKDARTYTNSGFIDSEVCDPFQALMILCSAPKQSFRYIGAFDSVRIYEGRVYGNRCRFTIDRITQRVYELSYVNVSGAVYERILFYYPKGRLTPSSVVVFKSTGGELVRDSVGFETK